jgi:transposase
LERTGRQQIRKIGCHRLLQRNGGRRLKACEHRPRGHRLFGRDVATDIALIVGGHVLGALARQDAAEAALVGEVVPSVMEIDGLAVARQRHISRMTIQAGTGEQVGAVDRHALGLMDGRGIAVVEMVENHIPIKEIVRRTGHSRGLVRKVLRGQRSDLFRVRESSLELHLQWLDEQWAAGHRNGAELWRRLKKQGFRGCARVVSEWAARRRRAEKADGALSRTPSAWTIARLLTFERDDLSKAETITVAAIEGGVPLLVEAREIIAGFQAMIRKKSLADLEPWLERARTSLVASFANGVVKDKKAVSAAITSPWSNGQTEGQITKLKLVKRQMYGRGKLDLLQARVIGAD